MGVLRALRFRIAASRSALLTEVLSRRFWPLFTLTLSVYALVAFGGLAAFPPMVAVWMMAGVALLALVLLFWGLRGMRIPTRDQAIDRLDFAVNGDPLASLRDHPAGPKGDDLATALWEAHQADMAARALNATVHAPALQLNSRDRYGLRLMAIIAALVAIVFAPGVDRATVSAFLAPLGQTQGVPPSVEAWANPPTYTGLPSIYLNEIPAGAAIGLPTSTEVLMRVYGADDAVLNEEISGGATALTGEVGSVQNAMFIVTKTGDIRVGNGRKMLAEWQVVATPDTPPTVSIPAPPNRGAGGLMELPFEAHDDYAVERGTATITLDLAVVDRRFGLSPAPILSDAIVVDLPMPVRGDMAEVSEILIEDFSASIWVGLPVVITLAVEDGFGQTATAEVRANLPGKRFFLPLAATLVEQRRDLLWSPQNDRRVLQVMRAVTYLPDDLNLSTGNYLAIRSAIRRLEYGVRDGMSDAERAEIAEAFWQIALQLEDGDLDDARERLRRAKEKLLQAVEEGADSEEIAELMDEVRDAADDYMALMAQDADSKTPENSENPPQMADAADQLQQMLDELQELAENGDEEGARALLEQMRQLMEETEFTQQQGEGGEQMQELQDTLRQQQDLSDETFQQLQEMLEGGDEMSEERATELAEQQEALRELLESMQSGAGEDSREQAGENMGEARDDLQDGDLGTALNEQAEAIENLREGIRSLGEELQKAGQGSDGLQAGETENRGETDPLGRPLGMTGSTEGGETAVPDVNSPERVQSLLDEIRRRVGETERPDAEIDYLKRLLDRF